MPIKKEEGDCTKCDRIAIKEGVLEWWGSRDNIVVEWLIETEDRWIGDAE